MDRRRLFLLLAIEGYRSGQAVRQRLGHPKRLWDRLWTSTGALPTVAACCSAWHLRIFPTGDNVIIILMSIELMLLAVNITASRSRFPRRSHGQVFALFVLTVAAAELRSLRDRRRLFRNRGTIAV